MVFKLLRLRTFITFMLDLSTVLSIGDWSS
nr:MAG TPA: hypothetical protein [Caudoviricetes sp.]